MRFNQKDESVNKQLSFLFLAICALSSWSCRAGETAPRLPEVVVFTAAPGDVNITKELNGRVSAFLVAEVRPQVNGIILDRLFKEGSIVQKGEPLYQIEPSMYQALLENAQANLANVQASVEVAAAKERRYHQLVGSGAVTGQDYDEADASWKEAEAGVRMAQSQVKIAQINVDYTKVHSPITGIVGKSNVTQGALVTASQAEPLTTVQQLDPIYVDVAQATADMRSLKRSIDSGVLQNTGQGHAVIHLILEDGAAYVHTGEVLFSDVTVDETTGTINLRAQFPNPDLDLLPGMYVKAVIDIATKKDAFTVPQQSLIRNPDGSALVYVVAADGTVERRPVTVLRALADRWLLSDGLNGGERVVVEGIQRIRFIPGQPAPKVAVVEQTAKK